jgi:hypothetical protein
MHAGHSPAWLDSHPYTAKAQETRAAVSSPLRIEYRLFAARLRHSSCSAQQESGHGFPCFGTALDRGSTARPQDPCHGNSPVVGSAAFIWRVSTCDQNITALAWRFCASINGHYHCFAGNISEPVEVQIPQGRDRIIFKCSSKVIGATQGVCADICERRRAHARSIRTIAIAGRNGIRSIRAIIIERNHVRS